MTKLSEDDLSSKGDKKDGESENDGTVINDPNHPLLKVRRILYMQVMGGLAQREMPRWATTSVH